VQVHNKPIFRLKICQAKKGVFEFAGIFEYFEFARTTMEYPSQISPLLFRMFGSAYLFESSLAIK